MLKTIQFSVFLTLFLTNSIATAQIASTWTNVDGGSWHDAGNWSTSDFPNDGNPNPGDVYNAIVDLEPGPNYFVAIRESTKLNSLLIDSVDATVSVFSMLETTSQIDINAGKLSMRNGVIRDSIINQNGGALEIVGLNNIFDGTTINGELNLADSFSATALLRNGSTFTGDARVSRNLVFDGTASTSSFTLDQGGTINLFGGKFGTNGNMHLTLGPSMTVRGYGLISTDLMDEADSSITNKGLLLNDGANILNIRGKNFKNEGTMRVESSSFLSIFSDDFVNDGRIEVGHNSRLTILKDFQNNGVIDLDDERMDIGQFTTAGVKFGTITRSEGSEIRVIGDWDNTGTEFTLDSSTGDFIVDLGTNQKIVGGVINQAGAKLLFSSAQKNILEDVTVNGLLEFQGKALFGEGAIFTDDANLSFASLRFLGPSGTEPTIDRVLNTGKTINLQDGSEFGVLGNINLELGPTMTIRGSGSIVGVTNGNGSVTNQGLISADIPDKSLTISAENFVNQGTLRATNSRLNVSSAWKNEGNVEALSNSSLVLEKITNNGTISLSDSELRLTDFKTAGIGTIVRSGDTKVTLSDWDNTGESFDVDSAIGDVFLSSVTGGVVNQTDAKLLFGPGAVVDGATINGGLEISGAINSGVRFRNGGTFNGDVEISSALGSLSFENVEGDGSTHQFTLDNGATINMDASGSNFGVGGNTELTIGPSVTIRGRGAVKTDINRFGDGKITNHGTISADISNARLEIEGDSFVNEGLVQVSNNARLEVENFVQNSGTTRLDNGTVFSTNSLFDLQGGLLEGNGSINGDVFNNGRISPGLSAGNLVFQRSLFLGSESELKIELGGLDPADSDMIAVVGNLNINGTLDVELINGFQLSFNNEFLIAEIDGNLSGMFTGLGEGDTLATLTGERLRISYQGGDGNDISLTAVPEPSHLLFVSLMMLGMCNRRKRFSK